MNNKFGIRTVLIPIFAVAGFFFIQIVVTIGYFLILVFSKAYTSSGFDSEMLDQLFLDPTKLLITNSNYISGIYSVLIIIVALAAIRILTQSNPMAIRREHVSLREWLASFLLVIGVAGVITLLMTGIQELAKYVPVIEEAINNYIELSENFIGSGSIPIVILTTCFIVPIAEDLVFRGIIQGELRRVMPGWLAVLIQAVIFALVHGNPIQISYVILPAIVLGASYEWTKSIYVPIALHMIFNFLGSAVPMMLADDMVAGGIFVYMEFAMIPIAVLAMVYLYRRRKRDPQII